MRKAQSFALIFALAPVLVGGPASAAQRYRVSDAGLAEGQGDCRFGFAGPAPEVAGFGVYEGKHLLSAAVGQGGHEAYVIPVIGPAKGPRRILLLTSYEAVVWDFSRAPVGRIAGVVLSGYYDQGVAGLPASVPVRFHSYQTPGPCGRLGYSHGDGRELAARLRESAGLQVTSYGGIYATEAVRFDQALSAAQAPAPRKLGAIRSVVPVVAEDTAPREQGIAQLIARKQLRPARPSDLARWNALADRRGTSDARFSPGQYGNVYVILSPLQIPRGMYGGYSATFLIEAGVPDPVDPGSHNQYYRLGDGSCFGGACSPPPPPAPPLPIPASRRN